MLIKRKINYECKGNNHVPNIVRQEQYHIRNDSDDFYITKILNNYYCNFRELSISHFEIIITDVLYMVTAQNFKK